MMNLPDPLPPDWDKPQPPLPQQIVEWMTLLQAMSSPPPVRQPVWFNGSHVWCPRCGKVVRNKLLFGTLHVCA